MKTWLLGLALACWAHVSLAQNLSQRFAVQGDQFVLDGKPFVIRSGEMHYPRIPREAWRDRLAKLRAMGLNTVTTYVFWNVHEAQPGVFDFTGDRDLASFLRIAQEEGLWVILRPGPYVCAEWEFGGLPSWLLKERSMKVRSSDPRFVEAAKRYILRVGEETRDLMVDKGGPILMVQVENEYGSFGTDRAYMRAMGDVFAQAFDGLRYTTDSVWGRYNVQRELSFGSLPELPMSINFGQTKDPSKPFAELTRFRPGTPKMAGEYWVGWFDTVGADHAQKDPEEATAGLAWMLNRGISFSLYMFHGGTNFGFMNGANWDQGQYKPDSTSYDYDAPLDEAGRPTAKYWLLRQLLQKYLQPGESLPPVPSYKAIQSIPEFHFLETAPLTQLLENPTRSADVQSMEDLGQDYGFLLYRHRPEAAAKGRLELRDLHDFALISQGSRTLGTLDRRLKRQSLNVQIDAGEPLDILVENMGRINFSTELMGERKGITESVMFNGEKLQNWEQFPLPLKDLSRLRFGSEKGSGPAFYRAQFDLDEPYDTYLDLSGFGKGVVFVNGRNLGRYWHIGPQQSLYCPASWLKAGKNEVIVFDLFDHTASPEPSMKGLSDPSYKKTLAPVSAEN